MKKWMRRAAGLFGLTFVLALGGCSDSPTAETPPATPPTISAQPSAVTVTAGATGTFSVTATGDGPVTYQWQRDGANISGATAASYSTAATTVADNGALFRVVVTNTAGSVTSSAVALTVNPPPTAPTITSQPVGTTVTAGTAANFGVQAAGTAPLTYQWQRDGVNIAGATAATYTLTSPVAGDSGATFRVVVSNAAGSVTSANALLTVAPVVTAPTIATQPQSANTLDGSTVQVSVAASGTAPFTYQWRRNGTAIAGATANTYTSPALTLADSGVSFSVVVTNSAGSVTSNAATITVNPQPVVLTAQPSSANVTAGQTATFSVAATGSAPINYQWRRNGTAIAGATAANYTTPATAVADSGALFTVLVSNAANTVTSNAATLTVTPATVAPTIATAPANVTISEGQTASFTVTAAGTAPLSYQWRRNAVDISGATAASYTTAATTAAADNGARYSVRVTNGAGTVTSADAVLTVNVATGGLIGRAWTTGVLLETDDNNVRDRVAGIDDAGRVTVVFRKTNGTRDVIYATRGTPNAAGTAPTWSAPVVIDVLAGAPVSTMGSSPDYDLVVTPGGNAVAYWYNNADCTSSTYRTSSSCRYYYMARFTASSGAWSAPELVGDAPNPSFTLLANDRGDVVFLGTSWVRSGASSYNSAAAILMRNPGETSFRRRLLNAEPLGNYSLDLDGAGNLLLAAEYQQGGTTDLVAYRGTVASGLGTPVVLDTRGAPATLHASKVGLNGQQAILWTQNNGVSTTTYGAVATTPTDTFTVTDLGFVPGTFLDLKRLFITDAGQIRYLENGFFGSDRRDWSATTGWVAVDVRPVRNDWGSNRGIYANRRGDLLLLNFGKWGTYDVERNVMVSPLAGTQQYVIAGVSDSTGFGTPALSLSGIGFISSQSNYDVLPTAAVPAGDGRPAVTNLWGIFFK